MQLTSVLMMVATGITLTSVMVMVFFFRPKWLYLAILAIGVSVSTMCTLLFMIWLEESYRKKHALRESCEDAFDLV
jgi:ABC-type transport system involved in Fe-S cluster assembly fused permease/ATPase subunit